MKNRVVRWLRLHNFSLGIDTRSLALSAPHRKNLGVWGFFWAEIGLGEAARRVVKAMRGSFIDCHAYGINLPDRNTVPFSTDSIVTGHSTNIFFVNPLELRTSFHKVPTSLFKNTRKIGHWVWELPVAPAAWHAGIECVDEIWTPSRFVCDAFASAKQPVRLAPYVVLDRSSAAPAAARQALHLPKSDFLFLTMFDFASGFHRKNPLAAVAVFEAAFPDNGVSSPHLIIKCHGSRFDRWNARLLRRAVTGKNRIHLIDRVMNEVELALLQDAIDCFVSLHRSEGFGLSIAEAMLLGKAVIATGFSGNMDFMRPDNSYPVSFNLRKVARGEYPLSDGQTWAEPCFGDAVEIMRDVVISSRETMARAQLARQHIQTLYSPLTVMGKWRELLEAK